MSSPSSPKDLALLPSGTRIFIDANIFIYHFTQVPLTAACTAFLQRVEAGDLHGITSLVVLAEVAHRRMILEAIRTFGFSSRTAVKYSSFQLAVSSPAGSAGVPPAWKAPKMGALRGCTQVQTAISCDQ